MGTNNYNLITSKQAAIFIVASQIGIGIFLLPSSVAESAGHDGWISVLIAGVIILLSELINITLCKRFGGSSILDINKMILGKYIAFFLNIILMLYFVFGTIASYALFISGVGIWFFRSTPLWVLALYLIIPSVYLSYNGLKVICRFNFIIFLFIPLVLSLLIANLPSFRITELLPIGSCGFSGILKSLSPTTFAFMGFETLLFIFPYLKEKQHITRHVVFATIISTSVYTVTVITSIGVFGEQLLAKRFVAIIGLARMLELPVLERVDLYYLAIWIVGEVLVINSFLFLAYNTTREVFNLKARLLPLLFVSAIVVICVSFTDNIMLTNIITKYSGYASFFIGALIPIFLLIIALICGKREKEKV